MYSSKLRVFTQLALVAVLLFMVAAVPAAFADSRAEGGPVSQDGLPGQAAKPAAAAGPSREMGLDATLIVYDAISNPLPPNLPSLGFQATRLPSSVTMSTWRVRTERSGPSQSR